MSIRNISKRNRKGFTLIELLVVVLILSILMAVALPLYLSAVADSQRKTCRANMQTIANAVQAAYVRTTPNPGNYNTWIGATVNAATIATNIIPDLSAAPVCPSGGTYTIINGNVASTTFAVQCSYTTGTPHGTFQPGVDSN